MPRQARVVLLAWLATSCGSSDGTATAPSSPMPTATPSQADLGRFNMDLLAHLDLQALTGRPATTAAGNWGYTSPDGRRFALTTTSVGLSIVEVTDPRRPRIIRFIEGAINSIREVKTYRQYLYVTSEAREQGLDIIDMGNPDKPVKVKTWQGAFVTAHTLWIDAQRGLLFANGAYLPTVSGVGGVFVLDIKTNPKEPKVIGKFDQYAAGGFYVHDSYLRGNTLFAAAIFDGFVAFLDVSDPGNIQRIGQFNTGCRFPHNVWPTADGRYLFTTDERTNCPIEGWDIGNPQAPVKVSQYIGTPAGGSPHNVMVDGGRLLIAHYTEGVHLLDVSDPARPRVMGFYDTHTGLPARGCWGAYIFPGSDLIVASDIDGGLFVLGYTGG